MIGGYVIGAGVHIYNICMYICNDVYMYVTPQKSLNGTIAVNLSFQTLAVDLSSNLLTSSTTAHFRNAFLIG